MNARWRVFFTGAMVLALVIALTACSGGGGGGGAAAGTGGVSGVVKDIATGATLAGVVISDGTVSATTDATGHYYLDRPVGAYTLSATAAGYEQTYHSVTVSAGTVTTFDWSLTKAHAAYVNYSGLPASRQIPAAAMDYVILAWNDLGMHCMQDDYSSFLILPPFNTLHVQVIRRGGGIVTSGITVSYVFPNKTDSTLHTNFWNYSSNYGYRTKYGWNATPNVGITGSPLAGTMALDANGLGFVATGIPITPYDDNGTWDPYGTATITVKDSTTGAVLATASVVAPVSSELNCSNCHVGPDPFLDILQKHDNLSGTTLVADRAKGVLHLCAECHADNALGLAGKPGATSLSLAMHNFHKDKMGTTATAAATTPVCYNCHPGPKTNCLRGIMSHAGMSCIDCHGDMSTMAMSIVTGRQPWLDEPRCGSCHDAKHRENDGVLYRNSVFNNTPDVMNNPSKMNGKLYCEGCHNSTHAEFTSTNPADNTIPRQLQGDDYWIWNCYVCHTDYMPSPAMHM